MSRRGFAMGMRAVARAAARAERAHQQAQVRKEMENFRLLRSAERQVKVDAKEGARLYIASRMQEAEDLTDVIRQREVEIDTLLARALTETPQIDLEATLKPFTPAIFDESRWPWLVPRKENFTPKPPSFFALMMPGAVARYERKVLEESRRFEQAEEMYRKSIEAKAVALEAFKMVEEARKAESDRHSAEVRELRRGLGIAEHSAVVTYYERVIDQSLKGEPDAVSAEIGYSPESRHLVVDLEMPELSMVPEEVGFKYIKSADRIDPVIRPASKRKALYAHLLSQVALKSIDVIFRGGPSGIVNCLTLNGMLDTIDPATGQQVHVCLLSVRVTSDDFGALNLAQVQPEHCLRSLKASVSRSPAELLPVKPLIELEMVDPRFVDTTNVMSGLDHRTNLMELSPTEFEGLITNLFAAMGLDTRQTRPSRDGGVDCVAFDTRPIFGGKVVIQAKRYKNTVGVSAVRDLFGTVQNEGASKGILVTTSGYGKAAYDFARGKPLELLDGGNLLHLLSEYGNIDARIIMPEGWTDLPHHGE